MSDPWSFQGVPVGPPASSVNLIEGTTFCVSDQIGDLAGLRPGGLFVRDTRILSECELRIDQRPVSPLTVQQSTPNEATFVGQTTVGPDPSQTRILASRHRVVGEGMSEKITLINCGWQPCRLEVALVVKTDLADLFEVKDGHVVERPVAAAVVAGQATTDITDVVDSIGRVSTDAARAGESLRLGGEGDYSTIVVPDATATLTTEGCSWDVRLAPHGTWTGSVEVIPRIRGRLLTPHHRHGVPIDATIPQLRRSQWWLNAPLLETGDRTVAEVLRTSIEDLGTLRIFDADHLDRPVVAAGSPWFMALFGRDSLLTSLMLLAVDTSLARGTCLTLASRQGRRHDAVTEEAPGKILHELRLGPAGTLALGGGSAYYGTADATPLFVMTLASILRWEGPDAITPDLLAAADRAMEWIVETGDRDGDGFVEYLRSTPQGLRNQGWKDSWDGVNFADGRLGEPPIALAEVQGYVYAAIRARAEIAAATEGSHAAAAWQRRADAFQTAFDEVFWLPDRGWYAAGLDHDKQPIDALTSSLGHLLWTGIVPRDRAPAVAEQLLAPELFTGWGIRTLASSMGRYDPMSYHNGSVWPHDTAVCVSGLVRYGFGQQAATVAMGLFDAAAHFGHRLPELFAGFSREILPMPVPVPGACSPQAWAAAAPVEVLRALLGLEPSQGELRCAPVLPERLRPLRIVGLPYGGRRHDIEVDTDGAACVSSTDVSDLIG